MSRVFIIFILTFSTTLLFGQKKSKQTDNTKPFVLGVIDEIQSKELSEKRVVNIYLPEGYNAKDTTVGKEGLAPTAIPHVMEVDANVLADKIKSLKNKHVNVYFDYLPLENHATIMHPAVFNAFRLLYPTVKTE